MNNYDDYSGKYSRAKQEEGKGTYEGLRRSQHMMFLRAIAVIIIIFLFGWLTVSIQGHIEGHATHTQFMYDVHYMSGGKIGKFSECDLDHNCPESKKNKTQRKLDKAKQSVKNIKNSKDQKSK